MVILRSHEHEAAQCTLQKQVVLEGTGLTHQVTKPVVSLTERQTPPMGANLLMGLCAQCIV